MSAVLDTFSCCQTLYTLMIAVSYQFAIAGPLISGGLSSETEAQSQLSEQSWNLSPQNLPQHCAHIVNQGRLNAISHGPSICRAPDLRRIELRGPGSDSAMRALLSSVPSPVTTKPPAGLPLAVGAVCVDPRLMPTALLSSHEDLKPPSSCTEQPDSTAGTHACHNAQLDCVDPRLMPNALTSSQPDVKPLQSSTKQLTTTAGPCS